MLKLKRKRFDANEEQARAWKRLEMGTHTEDDLTWLKHEKAESRWSGAPWTNTEDRK